jgi:hypothetical protein
MEGHTRQAMSTAVTGEHLVVILNEVRICTSALASLESADPSPRVVSKQIRHPERARGRALSLRWTSGDRGTCSSSAAGQVAELQLLAPRGEGSGSRQARNCRSLASLGMTRSFCHSLALRMTGLSGQWDDEIVLWPRAQGLPQRAVQLPSGLTIPSAQKRPLADSVIQSVTSS